MVTNRSALNLAGEVERLLHSLGVSKRDYLEGTLEVRSPISGERIARVVQNSREAALGAIELAHTAYETWRHVPPPKRGELVRLFGEELRAHKEPLGRLVSIEVGKIISEGLGEVQEMIDICDFAVGLSRQLYGLTIATERAEHRMMETWHPLGVTGIISAFNFPAAVWCWNAALALVCGNSVVWKPSEKTPLTALATHALFARALARFNESNKAPRGLSALLIGDRELGTLIVDHAQVPLVSATGSTTMGRAVGPRLAQRFARALLELGGNNAAVVCPSADLNLTVRAIAFAAMGTAGQRCTSLRRLFVHADIYEPLLTRLQRAYASVKIGNPLEADTLIGPLIDARAFEAMQNAIERARSQGGRVTGGVPVPVADAPNAYYVRPALVEMPGQSGPVEEETFAPILYVMRYHEFDEALRLHNAVCQGLSSSIFTTDLREAEIFMSAGGSDCGISNVNIGPSGAEIGGAFGGEKQTGGGRESGSDSWRAYMRRATNTINFGRTLPLAQGVTFDIDG
jgi:aldehyde dehydrogenase (NAD+)